MSVEAAVETLKNTLMSERNPMVIANEISFVVSDLLRGRKIGLYEAFILNAEHLRFTRKSYIGQSFGGKVRIFTCLSLLNQKLLADAFSEHKTSAVLEAWCFEAYDRNEEKRPHYVLDRFADFVGANKNPELLRELRQIRTDYSQLSDEEGPYHVECFPYHYYSPEGILLGEAEPMEVEVSLSPMVEDLFLTLCEIE